MRWWYLKTSNRPDSYQNGNGGNRAEIFLANLSLSELLFHCSVKVISDCQGQKDSKEKVLESKIFARWIPEKSFSSVLGVPEFCRNCSPHYVHKRCDRWDRLLFFPSFVLVFI